MICAKCGNDTAIRDFWLDVIRCPGCDGGVVDLPQLARSIPVHHAEVVRHDDGSWGFHCFTCNFVQRGVTDLLTAEEHRDSHRGACDCDHH
jgi:hypothetical protein